MKKRLEPNDNECSRAYRGIRLPSAEAVKRCFKMFLVGVLSVAPCVALAQGPRVASDGTDLQIALDDTASWDVLEINDDIAGGTAHVNGLFTLDEMGTGGTSAKWIGGSDGMKTLSYTGTYDANGRVFDLRNLRENEIVIDNLEFTGGKLQRGQSDTAAAIGAGAAIQNFQQDAVITISNSRFVNNATVIDSAGVNDQDAGAGGLYLNGGMATPPPQGLSAALLNTSFSGNTVALESAMSNAAAYGGGLVIADFQTIVIDGQGTGTFDGNSVTSVAGHGVVGGAVFIQGSTVDNTTVTIRDTVFSGNTAETADGFARGGAVYFAKGLDFAGITVADTSFFNNTVNSGQSIESTGGAISTDSDMTIAAQTKNVLFQGNRSFHDGGNGNGQSVYSSANVNYSAAAGRTIADHDGLFVEGTVTKDGTGTLALLGTDHVHLMGDLNVTEGVLESSIYNDGRGLESSFMAQNGLGGGTGTGTATFGANTAWQLDVALLSQADQATLNQTGVAVALGGYTDETAAQAALDRGTEQALFRLLAENNGTGEGIIRGVRLTKANMSDIRNSALLMHRWNTIREATNYRMELNDYYHRNCMQSCGMSSCGTEASCGNANCGNCGNRCNRDGRGSVWANYIGRYNQLESTYYGDDIDMSAHGVQAGIDLISDRRTQLGFMFGYESQLNKLSHDRLEADDYYFGLYWLRNFHNGFDLRANLGYGFQNYDMDRYPDIVASRLNRSSFDGDVYEASLELGRRLGCDRRFSFRPLVGVDYFNNRIEGTDESVSGIHYHAKELEQLYLRAGIDIQSNARRWKWYGGVFYSIQLLDDGDCIDSNVSQLGLTSRLYSADLGNSVLSYTVGTSIAINAKETWHVYGGYSGDIFLDRDDTPLLHSGHAGLLWRF